MAIPTSSLTPESELPKTPREWVKVFSRAHPDWTCLRCHQSDPLLVVPGDSNQDIPLSTIDRASGALLAYIPTIAVVCQNCGHVEVFDQENVLHRADAR
jgi:hypothetical protein